MDLLGEFPIDIFLLNPDTNYVLDKKHGRKCHFARVAFELELAERSLGDFVVFRRACAEAGLGRNLVAYVRPSGSDFTKTPTR